MEAWMPRLIFILILPLLPGCMAFGYPSLTYTPAVACLPPDVHAFKSTFGTIGRSFMFSGGEGVYCGVEEIPIVDGVLDTLDQSYFDYFVGGVFVAYFHHDSWKVILYRPGYEIVTIPSRWFVGKMYESRLYNVDWKPAKGINSQLEALSTIWSESGPSQASDEVKDFVRNELKRLKALASPAQLNKLEPE
jgi:hypothetical protein